MMKEWKLDFKPKFLEKYGKLLGDELEEFLSISSKPLKKSIRINTLKVSTGYLVERLKSKGWKLKRIPWYKDGFWVENEVFELGNTLEHQLGYFYVQEAASMIPPVVLSPEPGEVVLDLCASPGSKTTQMAQMMRNKGVIVANDVKDRTTPLVANLQRCGVTNAIVTNMDGRTYGTKCKLEFDKVLIDAPCSSTGAIRKNPEVVRMWNPKMVSGLSRLQKSLIVSGFDCLKEGGVLVYSTCTLEPEENEEVVNYLLRERSNAKIEKVKVEGLKHRKGLVEWEGKEFDTSISKCLRIYPHDNDTEGFFVCKVRKI